MTKQPRSRLKPRSRHLSDAEKARREEQAAKIDRDRRGVLILDNPNTTYKLKYDLRLPGGPFRSSSPSGSIGTIKANDESALLRDTLLMLVEQFGFAKYGIAAAGVIADAVNSYPQAIRQEIFKAIAGGTGLRVHIMDVTFCAHCGAERELVSIIDPNAPEDEQLEEQDSTVHTPECPTLPQVDAEAIAASEEAFETPPMRPGVEQAWVTRPSVYLDQPQKYRPLYQPQDSFPEASDEEATVEIPDDKLNEEVVLPDA